MKSSAAPWTFVRSPAFVVMLEAIHADLERLLDAALAKNSATSLKFAFSRCNTFRKFQTLIENLEDETVNPNQNLAFVLDDNGLRAFS